MNILRMSKFEVKTRTEFYIKMYWQWVEKNTHELNIRSGCKDRERTSKF